MIWRRRNEVWQGQLDPPLSNPNIFLQAVAYSIEFWTVLIVFQRRGHKIPIRHNTGAGQNRGFLKSMFGFKFLLQIVLELVFWCVIQMVMFQLLYRNCECLKEIIFGRLHMQFGRLYNFVRMLGITLFWLNFPMAL
ncbi:hypothetical protein FCV25MIE_03876 [Fagus crenata]